MLITQIETERLILRRSLGSGELSPLLVLSRATGKSLGTAMLEEGDTPGGWSIAVWLDARDVSGYAAETVAALTRVCLELLDAEHTEVFTHADDAESARTYAALGYEWSDRAHAGEGGPLVDRWVAVSPEHAVRVVPRLRLAGDLGERPTPRPEARFEPTGALAMGMYAD